MVTNNDINITNRWLRPLIIIILLIIVQIALYYLFLTKKLEPYYNPRGYLFLGIILWTLPLFVYLLGLRSKDPELKYAKKDWENIEDILKFFSRNFIPTIISISTIIILISFLLLILIIIQNFTTLEIDINVFFFFLLFGIPSIASITWPCNLLTKKIGEVIYLTKNSPQLKKESFNNLINDNCTISTWYILYFIFIFSQAYNFYDPKTESCCNCNSSPFLVGLGLAFSAFIAFTCISQFHDKKKKKEAVEILFTPNDELKNSTQGQSFKEPVLDMEKIDNKSCEDPSTQNNEKSNLPEKENRIFDIKEIAKSLSQNKHYISSLRKNKGKKK